jgi:DNA-binding NarL/FixJ family response regulator
MCAIDDAKKDGCMLDLNLVVSTGACDVVTTPAAGVTTPAVGAATASLRRLAARATLATQQRLSMNELWTELVAGTCRLVDDFYDERRCYALIQAPDAHCRSLRARERDLLERCLLGESEKVLAFDEGLSTATVASIICHSMRSLGFEVHPPRAPLIAIMAAHASRARVGLSAEVASVHPDMPGLRVVSMPRPEPRSQGVLTTAEREVLALLCEGLSNTEIAARRRRSLRTVANQMASLFQKFGISGRRQLVASMVGGMLQ